MSRSKAKIEGFPTPTQELLLRACLLKGEPALESWADWKKTCNFEEVDAASYRLLPLLHRNLQSHHVVDPLTARLQGIYRKTWYQNQILIFKGRKILKQFQEMGIDTLVLKGLAVSLLYYRDSGLRPMGDIDIFVLRSRINQAVKIIAGDGWRPINRSPELIDEDYFNSRHSHGFFDSQNQQIDLHWHLLLECCSEDANEFFWTGAQPLKIKGVPVLTLNPTDHIFHILIHGLRQSSISNLRWVADAVVILDTAGKNIDWDRLYHTAERFELGLQLHETLSYLTRFRRDLIPDTILQRLHSMAISKTEKKEYSRKTGKIGILGGLPQTWDHYVRFHRQSGNLQNRFSLIWNFPAYLTHLRGDKNLFQTVIRGLKSKMLGIKKN